MNGLLPLALESIQDAVRRRLAYVVGAVCVISMFVLDSCTAMLPSTVEVNGMPVEVDAAVASGAGLVTFVTLGLWLITLAGVLAADQLREPLEDGSATLALARPVSRLSFVLARLIGVLAISWTGSAALLGTAAYFLASRHGVPMAPASSAAIACALGCVVLATWSMTISIALPRIATTLLVFGVVGLVALANAIGAAVELTGLLGMVDAYGPPLASSMIGALASWLPENMLASLRVDPATMWVRLIVWAAAGVAALMIAIRRIELGR